MIHCLVRRGRWPLAAALFAATLVLTVVGARAASTFTVTTTADGDDGACTAAKCTLRDAIKYSSAGDTVVIPGASQPYTLTQGELDLTHNLSINGAGAGSVTISGNDNSRVFEIAPGVTASISGVTITHGNGTGGVIADGNGGAIGTSGGQLTLINSVVSNSSGSHEGGGIYDAGTATVEGTTFTGNSSPKGGAIAVEDTLTLTNSTITANTASSVGGGIYDDDTMNVTNATISGNSAPPDSSGNVGGANVFVDDTTGGGFQNTIVSNAQGGGTNCDTSGVFPTSKGNNLEDDNSANSQSQTPSCNFNQPGDQSLVDPKLGPLTDNGGPTPTMALQAGSPAIDAGATVSSITTDQRGGPRPQGAAYDIGAYEVGAVVDTAISKSASPSPAKAGQTLTYTLTARNNGPSSDPGFGVVVRDTLPSGVTLQSATASQGSCSSSSGKVTCNLGTIAKGATATVTIKVTPTAGETVTNTATVSSSAADSNSANNSATVSTQVQGAGASKPTAVTGKATGITFTSARVHGTVNPKGASTIYHFQYGRTTHYGSTTPAGVAGSGTSNRSVSAMLSRLRPGTVYHYRIVAQNTRGTVNGRDRTFRTPHRPSLHVAPSHVPPGARVRVFGNAGGCPAGDQVTLMSRAFSPAHNFAGVPAISTRVRPGGGFSTTTQIPSGLAAGRYVITGRCGGGNLGVSASLTVIVPRFTG